MPSKKHYLLSQNTEGASLRTTCGVMGQRLSSGGTGTPTASEQSGATRFRSYVSSLAVESGGGAAGSSGRDVGLPSSTSATPDRHHHANYHQRSVPVSAIGGRLRALSLGNFTGTSSGSSRTGQFSGISDIGILGGASSPESDDDSTDDGGSLFGAVSSLPTTHLAFYRDIKCPVCHKTVPPDSIEIHLVMCLTKPHIVYNEDVLTEDKGECSICLDDLQQGEIIARLPCLCIYHKSCIDEWFNVNRSCPEHPGD